MPNKWVEPERFLRVGDVEVFHLYHDDIAYEREQYGFSLLAICENNDCNCGTAADCVMVFDIRDLPGYVPDPKVYERTIKEAIKQGILTRDGVDRKRLEEVKNSFGRKK